MRTSPEVMISALFLFIGITSGITFLINHSISEAWELLQQRQLDITFSAVMTLSGLGGLIIFILPGILADRRRYKKHKEYGERYK